MTFQADALEFPFVAVLPKRERSRLGKAWDEFNELRAVMESKGPLVPCHLAGTLLDVSRARICQLLDDGRMEFVSVGGHRYIVESSLVEFAQLERKSGRPFNIPKTAKETWKRVKNSSK